MSRLFGAADLLRTRSLSRRLPVFTACFAQPIWTDRTEPSWNIALGTLEEQPSYKETVRPKINIIYIVFMLSPCTLAILCAAVACWVRGKCHAIPRTAWELLVLGKESPDVPVRGRGDEFPPMDTGRNSHEEQPNTHCRIIRTAPTPKTIDTDHIVYGEQVDC